MSPTKRTGGAELSPTLEGQAYQVMGILRCAATEEQFQKLKRYLGRLRRAARMEKKR